MCMIFFCFVFSCIIRSNFSLTWAVFPYSIPRASQHGWIVIEFTIEKTAVFCLYCFCCFRFVLYFSFIISNARHFKHIFCLFGYGYFSFTHSIIHSFTHFFFSHFSFSSFWLPLVFTIVYLSRSGCYFFFFFHSSFMCVNMYNRNNTLDWNRFRDKATCCCRWCELMSVLRLLPQYAWKLVCMYVYGWFILVYSDSKLIINNNKNLIDFGQKIFQCLLHLVRINKKLLLTFEWSQ